MNNAANVEYFYTKCNSLLGTNYTSNDWGGEDNKKKSINIEWIVGAVNKVYQKIHLPKNGCRLLLSTRFNAGNSKMAVNEDVVNSVVSYLSNLNKPCDNDCACATDRNCACYCSSTCASNCGRLGDCANAIKPHTSNCNCTTVACTCNCNCNCASNDCGSNTECQCDCQPYDCNCNMITNCAPITARPYTAQCVCDQGSNCPCACECNCSGVTYDGNGNCSGGVCGTTTTQNPGSSFSPMHTNGYSKTHMNSSGHNNASGGHKNTGNATPKT